MTEQAKEALSDREHEVATAYADGQNYKEIARTLGIAPSTVRTHLRTVYRKLGVTSRTELTQTLDAQVDTTSATPRNDADLIAELSLELDEAVRRERILARVLRIISQQGHSLDDVIGAVLDHALEICEAEFGILFEYHGDLRYRAKQSRNITPAFGKWLEEQDIFAVDPETGLGRVATRLTTISITDVRGENIYQKGAPLRIATADLGKARSFVAIPIMWGDRLLGAFTVYRTRVHPFNDRTLELAQLFADQAAIAIENARSQRNGEPHTKDSDTARASDSNSELPLLAILPFRAVDEEDATTRAIGRRLASSISMELASSPLFRMIDQASSFSPKITHMSPMQSAELLGAQLIVSGSIRGLSSGGYRIAPILHEAGRPAPIWNELFTSPDGDTNILFESLLTRLCAAIGTGVERQLLDAAKARRSKNQSAMDHFLEGLELHHLHGSDGFQLARQHFEAALDQDPDFARARAALAITFVREWFWNSDRLDLLNTAEKHARTAVALAPHDPWAQTVWGVVALYNRRHDEAAASFDRAMEGAPYDSYVVSRAALGKFYAGDFDAAIELFQRAIKLDPLHADRQRGMLGHAYFHTGQYDLAITSLKVIEEPLAWELVWLACCQAIIGDVEHYATAERYRASVQTSCTQYRARTRPFQNDADMRRLEAAMESAGIIWS
jgi:DNA-binding CsgD family transcriptional regulator/tetratricopeptide (TPR) repeat protein